MKRGLDLVLPLPKCGRIASRAPVYAAGPVRFPNGALITLMQRCNTAAKNNRAGVAKHMTN